MIQSNLLTLNIYKAFLKRHLAVPACCAGYVQNNFQKDMHLCTSEELIDFKYGVQTYRLLKNDSSKICLHFSNPTHNSK